MLFNSMHLEFQNEYMVDVKDNCKGIFVNHNYAESVMD